MAILLSNLPRQTQYSMRVVSAANDMGPAFGGNTQRLARKGTRFGIDVSVPALRQAGCGMALITDLVQGETEVVAFDIPEAFDPHPYGVPLVKGAGQAGSILNIDGLTPGVIVPKGKFLSVIVGGQRYAYLVRAVTVADAAGEAALPIWPLLRKSPADNAVVELASPKIEGYVPTGQEWSISSLKAVGLSFTVTERG